MSYRFKLIKGMTIKLDGIPITLQHNVEISSDIDLTKTCQPGLLKKIIKIDEPDK